MAAGCASGILNAPDPVFKPETDKFLAHPYGPDDHAENKARNKVVLQKTLGLIQDPDAPLFFWPSRLDPNQKGCQLLAEILYNVIGDYWDDGLQVVFVANGEYQSVFRNIVTFHDFHQRVAVCDFDEQLEHEAYGASDFILMPSRFEPCGLPQMIAPIYGALPIVHDTGGLHDTIAHLEIDQSRGNGFLFETYNAQGLRWAIDEAVLFHHLNSKVKHKQIKRIMEQSAQIFNHTVTARQYIDLYEKMLQRPLISASPY